MIGPVPLGTVTGTVTVGAELVGGGAECLLLDVPTAACDVLDDGTAEGLGELDVRTVLRAGADVVRLGVGVGDEELLAEEVTVTGSATCDRGCVQPASTPATQASAIPNRREPAISAATSASRTLRCALLPRLSR